jgi:hypothetical protein
MVALLALAAAASMKAATPVVAASGCTGTALFTTYFNWFDNASQGMVADNIHILNPGATTSSGCVTVTGHQGIAWSAGAAQETYVTMPKGTIGGPVRVDVTSGPAVLASERVQYYSSFHEIWGEDASQAAMTSYFSVYDKAGPGMVADNIHLLNPGTVSASVTVAVSASSLPNSTPVNPQTVSVGPGAEAWVTFPYGTYGGPVTITSSQPVLASQRVNLYQSFNEIWAESAAQASTQSYVTWYDSTFYYDNIMVLDPGSSTANVSLDFCGGSGPATGGMIPPGGLLYFTAPAMCLGSHCIACPWVGPLMISSDQPVLASQRVQYNSSFDELWTASAGHAAVTGYFNWYDRASPGMWNDNIHLFNPGTVVATVTVSLPGATPQVVNVPGVSYVNFPGAIGGPVTITSTQPVLSSQRVQYFSSFSEIWSA